MNAVCVAEDNKFCVSNVIFFFLEILMEIKNVGELLASELWAVLVYGRV